MSAIGPGDWVECVDVGSLDPRDVPALQVLTVGGLYRVAWVGVAERGSRKGTPIVRLEGIVIPPEKRGFGAFRFRPIWRGDKTLIETLLEPVADAIPDQVATEVSRVGAL